MYGEITDRANANVNANVDVYSLKSPWVQHTLQFTSLVLELSLIWSHLLWGEFSAADAIHIFSNFRSTRYASLLGGQRLYGMRGFAQHLYTLINFSDLWELVNLSCATICVGDCEANQSSWHECSLGGTTFDAHIDEAFISCLYSRLWQLHCLHLEMKAGSGVIGEWFKIPDRASYLSIRYIQLIKSKI